MAISKRVKTVREHVKAENAGDLDAALATFKHPRYEYVATDEVYDGPEEVLAHWRELAGPSPISRPRSSSCAGPTTRW